MSTTKSDASMCLGQSQALIGEIIVIQALRLCLGPTVAVALALSNVSAVEIVRAKTWPSDPEWLRFETRTLLDEPADQPVPSTQLTAFGGWRQKRFEPSGFFRTHKSAGVWWLVDPEGGAFVSIGLNSVDPGPIDDVPAQRQRINQAYGGPEAWARAGVAFMRNQGFNSIGSFSDWERLRNTPVPLPYTVQLGFMRSYAEQHGLFRSANGPAKYTDDLIPVFDSEFARHCEVVASQVMRPIAADPFLIGYFSDNELPFPADLLSRCLQAAEGSPNRVAAEAWLAERGITRDAEIGEAEQQAFQAYFADKYFSVVSSVIRRHDGNHLYLGSRLHTADMETRALFVASAQYADVVSYNWYREWNPRTSVDLARWTAWTDKPLIISEWYAKGNDVGLANTSGWGWTVPTQADRGKFYQHFALELLRHPAVVGFHWHRYLDNDPDDPTADASSRDSNKGFVDLEYQPYKELCEAARAVNTRSLPIRAALQVPLLENAED